MTIHECEQRTPKWFALRCGRITGTSFPTMAAGKKATIETLCLKTAAERITKTPIESDYTNPAMEKGIETEAEARDAYLHEAMVAVRPVGFVSMDGYIGVSPDGLVGEEGGVEIKCPQPHTHLSYLTTPNAWKSYKWQVQGALWVTGCKWWDFVSYCKCFPDGRHILVQRVMPDPEAFAKLTEGAVACRQRIDEIVEAYNG